MRYPMFRRPLLFLVPVLLSLARLPVTAQQPAGGKNLVSGGDFERSSTRDNLWDGVDGDGYLAGSRYSVPALAESGIRQVAMPVSVKLADMNGDKLPDIVSGDPLGYIWIYFNSGTPTEPKFTTGELLPVFLWQPLNYSNLGNDRHDDRSFMRRVPKVEVADWGGRGALDLIIGLYGGEVVIIPNRGSAASPSFQQPAKVESQLLATTQTGHLWGNLFSPVALDWNGDRQTDLLLGEGSYSANSVHLLLNSGSGSSPKFTDEQRYYLAYGNGREHLHPAVADMNGDGKNDLVVSDREGNISLYLNKASDWKPGDQLEFTSVISLGGSASQKNLISLAAGDYNGDGKIDLLFGKTNGRFAAALNTGSATEPKFSAPTEIKGTDVYKKDVKLPSGWDISTGTVSGNAWAVATVVDAASDPAAAPVEGKSALKVYYVKPLNTVIPPAVVEWPALNPKVMDEYRASFSSADYEYYTGTRTVSLVRSLSGLKTGQAYQFSFKHKGSGVRNARYAVGYRGSFKVAPDKVTQQGRGVKVQRFDEFESNNEDGTFSPGAAWTEATKSFTVKFKNSALKDLKTTSSATVIVTFELTGFDSVAYFDDFRLVEK